MKFLQIGLGSMGKRRIRSLSALGIPVEHIVGFDLLPERCTESERLFGIKTYSAYKNAVAQENPDVFIISTPPNQHARYFLDAAQNGKHFFAEISTTTDGYSELLSLLKNKRIVAAPSCTYRFYDPIEKIHTLLTGKKLGKIYFFTHHMGQYLPDWHPFEDYTKFYAAKKETSALTEMVIFELQWLSWVFGDQFTNLDSISTKRSGFAIAGNDLLFSHVKMYRNTLGSVTIDLLARPAVRSLRVIAEKGTMEWNWREKTLRAFDAHTKQWQSTKLAEEKPHHGYTSDETMYLKELRAFLNAVSGKTRFPYTFKTDAELLQLVSRSQ